MSVPKLRFPEFENAGEWDTQQLDDYLMAYNERISAETNIPIYSSTREGLLPQREYYNGRELVNESEYGIVPNGFFVYRHMSDDGTFKFNINTTGACIAVSKEYPVFSTTMNPYFLQCLLNDSHAFEAFAFKLKKGGTRTRLYLSVLQSWSTFLPSLPEQKKISDCLSSLDDLITAHKQKLNVLKTHKKGLMQQLFPAEGETVPRLRFPEFENAGEWEVTTLGKCLVSKLEYGLNAPAVEYSDSLPTYLRITDISEDGAFIDSQKVSVNVIVTKENYLKEGDIVLTRTGASVGKSYRYNKDDGELVFAGFLIRIRPDPTKVSSAFIYYNLNTSFYWKWINATSVRSGQPGVNSNEYSTFPLTLPSLPEQKKIADFLSSLDAMIAAQTEKIESLKLHKKGLMQQLFPQGEA